MGHPDPFDLRIVAIGNEECAMSKYRENYLKFYDAIKQAYPDIQIISNCDASQKPLDHPADFYDFHVKLFFNFYFVTTIVYNSFDVVHMVSYAPLFVNTNDRKWTPDAIVFDSHQSYGTPSYWIQQFFSSSSGATLLDSTLETSSEYIVAVSYTHLDVYKRQIYIYIY
ncbi:alpha-N-arabinofuranosidase [Vigna unguiculata]|uniref:non-reducing end alpha-L-arabinofuranosidase n=1 Tax=Vigna unguiculata TaxID=3917 RepID=A0A4D6M7F3_VIGUN|nr:alpha-N-arabinofuranosidase [Vigna unguiculata]